MKKSNIIIVLLGILTLLAFVFQACKKDETNEGPTPPTYTNGKGEIGTVGGTVKLTDPQSPINGASITIPEGALTNSVEFNIVQPDSNYFINGSNNHLFIEILPSGIQFNKPVNIGVPYQSIENEANFRVFYYNPENGELEKMKSVELDKQNKIFYVETEHTSIYFCDEEEGGGSGDAFTDPRDGQTYKLVAIGNQTWFAENLNFQTDYSWCYDDDPENCITYGRLYTWNAAIPACPVGWHIPEDEEWKELEMYLGMSQEEADKINYRGTDEGKKLKSTSGWNENGNGIDAAGFTALPGSFRHFNGNYYQLGNYSRFWTATKDGPSNAWHRDLHYESDKVVRNGWSIDYGFSVRCVKD